MYTLKVNIRAKEEREKREKERQISKAISKLHTASGSVTRPRKRKGLNFHQPGTFIARAEQLRKKAKLEELKKKIAERAAKTGIANAAKLASLTTSAASTDVDIVTSKKQTRLVELELENAKDVPDREWWDEPILARQSLDEVVPKLAQKLVQPESIFHGITNLVEHPPLKKPPGPDVSNIQIPIFLTQSERKKLRRQNRRNQELEKQQKIKLGLLPKPEPKLKRSNIMYALGDEAITNPSLADRMVRDQEEKRLKAHIEHNDSKRLTLEEKRAKKLRKIQEDLTVTGIWASVYRITHLSKQSYKLKTLVQNAKQLTMTGTVALVNNVNVVIVEGGPKQQRKFKHLILDRMKWSEEQIDPKQEQSNELTPLINRCDLVWEGQVPKRAFDKMLVKKFSTETEVRNYLKDSNIEHYWDLAYKMSILESIDDAL